MFTEFSDNCYPYWMIIYVKNTFWKFFLLKIKIKKVDKDFFVFLFNHLDKSNDKNEIFETKLFLEKKFLNTTNSSMGKRFD